MPKLGSHKPGWSKFLRAEQVARLLEAPAKAGAQRDADLLACMFYLALRIGEAVRLQPEHLRVEQRVALIPTLKKRAVDTRGRRVVPLVEIPIIDGMDVLLAVRERARGQRFLFMGQGRNMPLSARRAEDIFRRWARAVELPPEVTSHSLRHTACSLVGGHTKDPVLVRDFARHSNVVTSNTYLHTLPNRIEQARGALSLGGSDGQPPR